MKRTPVRLAVTSLLAATLLLSASVLHGQDAAALNESIRHNRMGTLVVTAKPGSTVQIEQVRHEFWFGAALAGEAFNGKMRPADAARYKKVFLADFNCGVMESALKWLDTQPDAGAPNYATADAILTWADQNRIPLRGHNIYWGSHHWVQPWVKALSDDALRAALKARGEDIAHRYRGRFVEYDFNNEMIHGDYYVERLGPGITAEMARWVRSRDPAAKLFVNDYDVLTGNRLDDYIAHIKQLQASGIPIAGIGVQGHLHGDSFDPAALQHALDELAKLGLPIRVTEFNFPGQRSHVYERRELALTPDEERAAARALVDYYRICFAHPSVTGILMWGFWEDANWIPQSSLYKRDWTPTPAGVAYRQLVFKEWWTRQTLKADANGRVELPAFYGTYKVTSGKKTATIELPKAAGSVTATLR